MSQENVEIVRSHIEAFGHDAERALSFLDPRVVVDPSRVGGVGVAYGPKAVARAVGRFHGAFEKYAYEIDRLTDLGSGAVVAAVNETGRGRTSGTPVQRSFAALHTLIDGKIVRVMFPSEAEALEAAGLRE